MKIVLITHRYPPVYNGPGRAAESLGNGLRQLGAEVIVLTRRMVPVAQEAAPAGMEVVRFGSPVPWARHGRLRVFLAHWFDLQCALWLVRHRERLDVIQHMAMPNWSFWILKLTARLLSKPLFTRVTMRGGDDLPAIARSRSGSVRLRWCSQIAGVVAMTPELGTAASANGRAVNVIVLPKYINPMRFRPARAADRCELRHRLGIGVDAHALVFVGSVDQRKGADLAVESLAAIRTQVPHARLYFVGPVDRRPGANGSSFGEELAQRVRELRVEDAVTYVGLQDDVTPWLQAADTFVFPSRNEGVPSALLEALATGIPTVICKQPWVPPELSEDRRFGRVVEPEPSAIADAVVWLHRHPSEAEAMGSAGRQFVQERHGAKRALEPLLEVYRQSVRHISRRQGE